MNSKQMKTEKQAFTIEVEARLIDEALERAVVCAMLNGSAYNADTDSLTADCFETEPAKDIFMAIAELKATGKSVDPHNVWTRLRKKGSAVEYVSLYALAKEAPCFDLDVKVPYLHELVKRRGLLEVAYLARSMAVDTTNDVDVSTGKALEELRHIGQTAFSNVKTIGESMMELRQLVDRNMAGGESAYSRSGFACIDRNAMLRPEALTVIAAHSAHGKSALALTIAHNVAASGQGVAYYSLEMSDVELTGRIAAHLCDTEPIALLYGVKPQEDLPEKLDEVMKKTKNLPIYFDSEASHTVETLVASIRQMARSKKVAGVVVDYLQILVQTLDRQKYQTEESALGGIVRRLKNLAKQEGIWILLLSQLNRNHDREEPQESDLRGSGQILETADNCVLLWRAEKTGQRYRGDLSAIDTHNTAQLRVAKARTGNDGERDIVRFVADRAHFEQPKEALPKMAVPATNATPKKKFSRNPGQRDDRQAPEPPKASADNSLPFAAKEEE